MQPSSRFPVGDLEAHLRFLKLLHGMLLTSVALYGVALWFLADEIEAREPTLPLWPFLLMAGILAALVLYLHQTRIQPLLRDATREPSQRIVQLRFNYIVCYVLAETVALFGFVTRFLGGSWGEAAPFFVVSVLLFGVCYPRRPATLTTPLG